MKFTTVLLAITASITNTAVMASPAGALDPRQTEYPKAECCCCDLSRPGYVCRVPDPVTGCPPCNKALCPFNPETEKQCCCCGLPGLGTNAVGCSAIPKENACPCPAIFCPIQFNESYLPIAMSPV